MVFSGAAQYPNEAASARHFADSSGESADMGTRWRRGGDSNPRSHKGSRDFESRRLNLTPEPLRALGGSTFERPQSSYPALSISADGLPSSERSAQRRFDARLAYAGQCLFSYR